MLSPLHASTSPPPLLTKEGTPGRLTTIFTHTLVGRTEFFKPANEPEKPAAFVNYFTRPARGIVMYGRSRKCKDDLSTIARLQKALFPEGLTFFQETFGTTKTSLIFNLLEAQEVPKANMASPAGFEPALPP